MPPEPARNDDDDDNVPTMQELNNRFNRLQYPENNDRVVANRNTERDDYGQQVDPRMVGLNADQLDRYHQEMERRNLEAYQDRLQHEGRQGPFTRIDDDGDDDYIEPRDDDDDDDDYIEPYDEEELERRIDAFNNRDGNVQQQGGRKRRKTNRKRKSSKKRKTVRKKRGRKRKTTKKRSG